MFIRKYWHEALLSVFVIGFVIFKIPDLLLPCYWDEAWPFSLAIYKLYEHGISFSPGAIDPFISRGHPVLFHFLVVLWMNVFGTSLPVAKTFPLLLSVILIIVIYLTGKKLFSKEAGLTAAFIFCLQAVFLAQSSFLLLEVQLALFSLLTFYYYFKNKRLLYVIFGSLTLLTKETGIIVIATTGIWEIVRMFMNLKEKDVFRRFIINEIVVMIPVVVASVYFIVQKMIHGWFFFPTHVDFMSFSPVDIKTKLRIIINFIFFEQGRYIITLLLPLILLIRYFLLNRKIEHDKWEFISVLILFVLLFIAFGSMNFLSNRYLLCTLPPVILIFAYILTDTFSDRQPLIIIGLLFATGVLINSDLERPNNHDDNLGFRDAIEVHRQMVRYCETNNMFNDTIFTHFLMRIDLTNPYAGYLSDTSRRFTNTPVSAFPPANYYIFSNVEYSSDFDTLKARYDLSLKKRFEKNRAWVELYEVVHKITREDSIYQAKFNWLVEKYLEEINIDPEWMKIVREKAKTRNITVDSMIKLDAIYMAEQEMRR